MPLFFRSEPFGGVVVDDLNDNVAILPKPTAEALLFLSDRKGDAQASKLTADSLKDKYQLSDATALRHVDRAALLLTGVFPEDLLGGSGETTPERFPVLSYPLDLFWEITRRCNENCVHCYNNSSPHGLHPRDEHIFGILDELKQTRLRRLNISGGEPLAHPKFEAISERARTLCHHLSLSSNGTLITAAKGGFISNIFDEVNISLDSPDAQFFDTFRGKKGAFQKTLGSIRILARTNAKVVVQTVVTHSLRGKLDQLAQLIAPMGVDSWNIRVSFSSGRELLNTALFPAPAQMKELGEEIELVKAKYGSDIPLIIGGINYQKTFTEPYRFTPRGKRLITCSAATILAALAADGTLSPCPLFSNTTFRTAPIWGIGLKAAWSAAACMEEMRATNSETVKGCGTCANLTEGCGGGCRAKAYQRKGTIYSNDYHCGYSA